LFEDIFEEMTASLHCIVSHRVALEVAPYTFVEHEKAGSYAWAASRVSQHPMILVSNACLLATTSKACYIVVETVWHVSCKCYKKYVGFDNSDISANKRWELLDGGVGGHDD